MHTKNAWTDAHYQVEVVEITLAI